MTPALALAPKFPQNKTREVPATPQVVHSQSSDTQKHEAPGDQRAGSWASDARLSVELVSHTGHLKLGL